ncbi:hypothetical protein ON010_g18438 [Phytophthora cinnamomi]|nr:hypothetical protein ON010_g18438 [Phytophthora cinnamomi]
MLRGVSGGERKRVTTGEMEFGMKYMTLMDEISTGLDSATAFDIISTQRSIAKTLGKTVVISLLQPSPEIFALFDNVLILNAGEVMYHGPCGQALSYFESLGFRCPPHRDVADFLLDLGTNQQLKYHDSLPAAGLVTHPRWPVEFGQHFQRSNIYRDTLARLDEPWSDDLVSSVGDVFNFVPEFQQSFIENVITVTWRQVMVAIRNIAFIRVRGFMVIVLALLYGSLYYQLEPTNVQVAMGVLFQSLFFLGLGQYAQVPGYCSIRIIFYKQRRANFIRTSAYVLACSASQIPWALGETIVFGTIVYWMCGFVATAGNFLLYELLVFQTLMAFAAWYFFMAAVTPDMHIAKPASMMSIFTFVAFAGFVVPKNQIPDYFIWIYWLDPIAWCLRSVAVSQYRSSAFDVCEHAGVNYCKQYKMNMGEYFLSLYDVPSSENWVWIGVVVLFVIYAVFMVLGWAVLEYKRYESPEHITMTGEEDTASFK